MYTIVFAGGSINHEGCTDISAVKNANVPLTTPICSKNKQLKILTEKELKEIRGCLFSGNKTLYHCARTAKTKAELETCLAS
ncbi:MAG: Unknown protein [uncultured Sulfurovum sp.]|uniref:Uncharacterized protein n=1 Tax=uncultured Sulfurovum sp. TaxID=269237 RepID=A0A6S6SQG5_9BACT|nr:MAG: Unknown protein [uncultured Sulfurovum sp.]